MSHSKYVIFYVEDNKKKREITKLCSRLGFQTKQLSLADINTEVGVIAGINKMNSQLLSNTETVKAPIGFRLPEILIFSGFTEDVLDIFLSEYKKAEIEPIALKAVITLHNIKWSLYQLVSELLKERASFLS